MVWSFLTGRKTSYQGAKQQFSITTTTNNNLGIPSSSTCTHHNNTLSAILPENHLQEDIHKLRLDTSSTSSFGEHYQQNKSPLKEPLDPV